MFSFHPFLSIQDVGINDDPNGALWETLPVLTVESQQPACDLVSECGLEPCVADKTCVNVPLNPYGEVCLMISFAVNVLKLTSDC